MRWNHLKQLGEYRFVPYLKMAENGPVSFHEPCEQEIPRLHKGLLGRLLPKEMSVNPFSTSKTKYSLKRKVLPAKGLN